MTTHIPFTYYIEFTNPVTKQKLFYYGSKYARGCHPDDLWTTYFTSSKEIISLITQYGKEAFKAVVRRTFPNNPKKCVQFETGVLRRLNVIHNDLWINRSFGPYYLKTPSQNEGKVFLNDPSTGKHKYVKPDDANKWIMKGWEFGWSAVKRSKKIMHNPNTGEQMQTLPDDIEVKMSEGWLLGYPADVNKKKSVSRKSYMNGLTLEERSKLGFGNPNRDKPKSIKGYKKITNLETDITRSVHEDELDKYIGNGWRMGESNTIKATKKLTNGLPKGYKMSDDVRKNNSEAQKRRFLDKENHPMYGKTGELSPNFGSKHSEESKAKRSESNKRFHDENPAFAKERAMRGVNPESNAKKAAAKVGTIKIIKDGITKMIKKELLPEFMADGWMPVNPKHIQS